MYGKKSCAGLTCRAISVFAKKHYLCKKMNDDDFKKRIESEY